MRINGHTIKNSNNKPVKQNVNAAQISFGMAITPVKLTKNPSLNKLLQRLKDVLLFEPSEPLLKMTNGERIPAYINKPKKGSWNLQCRGETVGTVLFSRAYSPIKGDNYPEYYKNKAYLYINSLDSHKTYKGIGTALVKSIVEESKRLGLEGRVCLNASVTKAEIGTPIPFYYKLGFECADSKQQKIVEECMREKKPLPKNCESATMFLPTESIKKLTENNSSLNVVS